MWKQIDKIKKLVEMEFFNCQSDFYRDALHNYNIYLLSRNILSKKEPIKTVESKIELSDGSIKQIKEKVKYNEL